MLFPARRTLKNRTFFQPLFSVAALRRYLLGWICLSGCTHLPEGSLMGDEPAPVREVLRIGQTVEYSFPLPAMTPVWVDRLQGNRRLSSRLAFRAWDMNDDGRFDMLEAIDPGGRVLFRAYDLDFDGEVDETEEIPPPSGDETVPVSSLH